MLGEYIAVDLETTGLKPDRDRILEIGAVHRREGRTVAEFQTLVRPGMMIPAQITELTGITDEMAEGGCTVQEALEAFLTFCGELPLVGHNLMFDYGFLKQNTVNQGLQLEARGMDTLKLARQLLAEPEKKSLEALCAHFQISRERGHRALDDAQAAADLLELLWRNYGDVRPDLFVPKPLVHKAKKQGPITPRQKKYLKDLIKYHKIELPMEPDALTKNEASRLVDKILTQYGRIPRKAEERI